MAFFENNNFSIKILSVEKLSWNSNDTYVQPRNFNAISFRLKGDSDFFDGKNNYHLDYGDILFIPEKTGYRFKSGAEKIIVVYFELKEKKQSNPEVITPKHTLKYQRIFENLYKEWNLRENGYYFRAMSYFYNLLSMLANHSPILHDSSFYKIKKSVEYLNQNFTDPNINIMMLAEISNVSDTYFRKLFYSVYNTTPLIFLKELRINYAVELIETGYYSMKDIAEKCGFRDVKYFSTVFKKYMNCSPSHYKKNFNEKR